MRPGCWCGGILGFLVLAAPGWAEPPGPFTFETRVITSPQVEVRSGPSPRYYATGLLKAGETVEVVTNKKDAPAGWLAIKPPRGSFSWVNSQDVSQDGYRGAVIVSETPVLPGSQLSGEPPNVRSVMLQRGSQFVIVGQPLVASNSSRWLPIEPYWTEVRYIPEDATRQAAPVQAVAAKPPDGTGSTTQGPSPLGPDAARVQPPAVAPTSPATTTSWNVPAKLGPPNPVNGGSVYRGPAATGAYGPAPTPHSPQTEFWVGPGLLLRANVTIDGKVTYRLEDYEKNTFYYVVAQPGFNLESYVNRKVQLYGPFGYWGEGVRVSYLSARAAHELKP
jgi:hypothetical protein